MTPLISEAEKFHKQIDLAVTILIVIFQECTLQ